MIVFPESLMHKQHLSHKQHCTDTEQNRPGPQSIAILNPPRPHNRKCRHKHNERTDIHRIRRFKRTQSRSEDKDIITRCGEYRLERDEVLEITHIQRVCRKIQRKKHHRQRNSPPEPARQQEERQQKHQGVGQRNEHLGLEREIINVGRYGKSQNLHKKQGQAQEKENRLPHLPRLCVLQSESRHTVGLLQTDTIICAP